MKRVLGISFGRRDGNCDLALKLALAGVKEQNDELEVCMINTCNMRIDRCTGCGACDVLRDRGKMSVCVRQDDFQKLEKEIYDADAIICAAPVYVLAPVGQYKNLVDRIGPSHDVCELELVNRERLEKGVETDGLIPEKYLKRRPIAYISVGGARTQGWTSMGLSGMYLFGFPQHMVPVDALNLYGMADVVSPVLDEKMTGDLHRLGQNIADSLAEDPENITWKGENKGVCPVCHCDQLTYRSGTTVECSVCGSIGNAVIENGELKIRYSESELNRSRFRYGGDLEHILEIRDMKAAIPGKLKEKEGILKKRLKELECLPITVL